MRIFAIALFAVLLVISSGTTQAQTGDRVFGEFNLLTDPNLPFPPGCLSIALPEEPSSEENILAERTISVPTALNDVRNGRLNVLIWRVACADEDYSVVLVRLTDVTNDARFSILTPQIFIKRGFVFESFGSDSDQYVGRLQNIPTGSDFGAEGNIVSPQGRTWILAVERFALGDFGPVFGDDEPLFIPEFYNERLTLELTWENYSRADNDDSFLFRIDRFEPSVDLPQFDQTILNGRYSGLYLRAGAERQGLVIQVAEQGDANFIFAIFFTFIDGEPIWVVSNSAAVPMEPGPITMRADIPRGGAFMTDPLAVQPGLDEIDLERAGEISVEAVDCNNIKVHYDFRPINKGTGTLDLFRLVRTAGYDCNPWE